jgi:uncharacterized protein YggU (UPF0235/DUF167 family)
MLLEACREGVILAVKAFPGAKRNAIREAPEFVKVFVTQVPEKGKANEAIRKQIAKFLNIRASQVELIQGETYSQKKFLLRQVSVETVQNTLAGIFADEKDITILPIHV